MTIEISPAEQQILIDSMRDRIGRLYKLSEEYKNSGFKECQMDCLEEKKKVQTLLNRLTK